MWRRGSSGGGRLIIWRWLVPSSASLGYRSVGNGGTRVPVAASPATVVSNRDSPKVGSGASSTPSSGKQSTFHSEVKNSIDKNNLCVLPSFGQNNTEVIYMLPKYKLIVRQQLDKTLSGYANIRQNAAPVKSWIRAIRNSYFITHMLRYF